MLSLFNPFDELLKNDEFFSRMQSAERAHVPAVDVIEEKAAFVLKAELPGIQSDDIDINVDGNVLTLKGQRRYEGEKTHNGYKRIERRFGSFRRSFTLPDSVNADSIDASLDAGILTVRIPKRDAVLPRKVTIRSQGESESKIGASAESRA